MADPFMGQIMQVAFNYAPEGWSTCAGQLINVSQNQALFSLLGNTFGGSYPTTFGLPDAQSRVFVGVGQGNGLSRYGYGQKGGSEGGPLALSQMPAHSHAATFTPNGGSASASLQAMSGVASTDLSDSPQANGFLANAADTGGGGSPVLYVPAGKPGTPVNLAGVQLKGALSGAVTLTQTGGAEPVPVIQPYLAMTTIIAISGIYPVKP